LDPTPYLPTDGSTIAEEIYDNMQVDPTANTPTEVPVPLPATAPALDLLPIKATSEPELPFLHPTSQALLTDRSALPAELLRGLCIQMADFLLAIPEVQPSSTREGFTSVPSVKWEAVGGVKGVREVGIFNSR
jgi:ribosome biogenesis ATPase